MLDTRRLSLSRNSNITLAVLLLSLTGAAQGQKAARDLTEASLEDLMNIVVTTVSKKEQKLSRAAAAVFVITQEDIRRSGMTTIPDLLRMVPGLQVEQMQSGTWAVSARGFNSQASDKMLVMVDGRSIYSPLSKGVFWDQQDILLEDIERIEVVRGPGATLWGANAVDGVVNIITKSAVDTQGSVVTAGAGPGGQALGGLRFGGALGDNGHYRIFSKYSEGHDLSVAGMNLDGTRSLHGGFRADWTLSSRNTLTLEGDLYHTSSGETLGMFQLTPPFVNVTRTSTRDAGGDLMLNWSQRQSDRSQTALRVYVDHSGANDPLENSGQSTVDVDFQHQLTLSESNGLVWGLGFRDSAERQESKSFNLSVSPPHREDRLFSAFVQDQWKILGDQLTHRQSDGSKTELRVYFDSHDRNDLDLHATDSTIDVDFQQELALSESNDLIWGLGLRNSVGDSTGTLSVSFAPPHYNNPLFSGFVQDQWKLADGRFSVIVGSKIEHNNYTGVEIQPSARLLWSPDNHHTMWAAVSRAVRTPSAADRDLRAIGGVFPGEGGTPTGIGIFGDPSFRSENLLAYELGYRLQAKRRFSVDASTFYNVYRHLGTHEPGEPFYEANPQPAHVIIPIRASNQMHGDGFGAEISSTWNVTERWRLIPSYTWLRLEMALDPTSQDQISVANVEGSNPRNGFQFRSNLDLSRKLQSDLAVYYTGALPALDVGAYTRVDARLGYRPRSDIDISFTGQNLQGGRHTEFVSVGPYTRASIGRSFFREAGVAVLRTCRAG